MKFTLDGTGAQAAGQGIGNLFRAFALGPMFRQQAEQDAATKAATAYAHTEQGNKYGTEAEAGRFTLDQRRNVDADIEANPAMPEYERTMRRVFKMTGDTHADRVAKAGTEFQTQGFRQQAIAEPDLDKMNRIIAVAGDKPYMPFDNVGNTGYSFNKATGTGGEINPVLAKIFQTVEQSKANENNAQAGSAGAAAGLSNARKDRVVAGLDKPVTIVDEDTGQATVTTLPTKGAPVSIGVAPSKGTGEAATNAKTRNAIIAAVEKDLGGYASEAEISAEVAKRLARRGMNKSPAPAAAAPKINASVPKDHKLIGTSGGKPVYQGPDGKRYIME